MKLIVISDTHGRSHLIDELLSRHKSYDALIFLGDGLRDFLGREPLGFVAVRGNCDGFSLSPSLSAPEERELVFDGVKILALHGHSKGVKSGLERLAAHGVEVDADIVLYGHTHVADERYYPKGSVFLGKTLSKPMYLFNPGSLGAPRGSDATFGVIEIRNGQVLLSHGKI